MYKNYIKSIGNTPLVRINRENIFLKLEGHNPSGSIKDRSISNMICNIGNNHKKPYCLITSGSAGLALYNLQKNIKMNNDIIIIMPKKYSNKKIPKKIIEKYDTIIHNDFNNININNKGKSHIVLIDDIFINTLSYSKKIINYNKWILLDQHYNESCINIHKNTVKEILKDLPDVTDIVCATGTGGTAAGLVKYLPKNIKVHSRFALSGDIEGLSDVGKYNNFCEPSNIYNYYESNYKLQDAIEYRNILNNEGFIVGESTGASYWLSKKIYNDNKKIVVISADGIINL